MAVFSFVLFFLSLFVNSVLNFLRYMHMFQLNSYHTTEQLKWISQNPAEILKRHIVFPFLLLPLLILGFWSYSGLLSGAAALVVFSFFSLPKKAKKKLVFTPRVIRMCVTGVLLYAAAAALTFIFGYADSAPTIVYPLLQLSILFFPMLANLVNKPVEALINRYYINDAKRIINELPKLITVGITGSYGKTSTKFYLHKLLSAKYNVLMTPESFNTTMGVVKTVRGSLDATYDIFICEMGAKNVGEIKEICDIVHPQHSMITSIGLQHLETFKTQENIIRTKFEIAECISDGFVFLNYDNRLIKERKTDKNTVGYGIGYGCGKEYYAADIKISEKGTSFVLNKADGEKREFSTKLIGEHNVLNIVGAIAVANKLGVPLSDLVMPVRRLECVPHRMEIIDRGNTVIIDDAFNSNPSGAKAALDALALMNGLKIIVTPGMVELGDKEYELNKTFGAQIAGSADFVVLVGEKQAVAIKDGLSEAKYPEEKIFIAQSLNEALAKVDSISSDGTKKIVLLENDLPDNF